MISFVLLFVLLGEASLTTHWPLSVGSSSNTIPPGALETLVCVDSRDLYRLLYRICTSTVLCRELYYLDATLDAQAGVRDFDKFVYQLSLIRLFGESGANQSATELFASQIWPLEWCPYYEVRYDATVVPNCSQQVPSLTFIYAATSLMMTYKEYISNEHYCNDHNERLIYDAREHRFHCQCRHGRSCSREPHFHSLVTLLVVMIMGLVGLLLLVDLYRAMKTFSPQ